MWGIIFGVLGASVGIATVVIGFATLRAMVKQTTAADKERADEEKARTDRAHADEVLAARVDEREKCRERTQRILAELAEMTTDRNAERTRADGLQQQINDRGLGPR